MQNRQKKFFARERTLARPQKSPSANKMGQNFGYKKRRILRGFQKYKLVLVTKCP
jgi:hypothetical protein